MAEPCAFLLGGALPCPEPAAHGEGCCVFHRGAHPPWDGTCLMCGEQLRGPHMKTDEGGICSYCCAGIGAEVPT